MKPVLTTFLCAALLPAAAVAADQNIINTELADAIDFRSVEFAVCEDQTSCTVGPITISAERQPSVDADWEETKIYWDPVDGLGIRDGGQNDEIDFDERLTISFSEPVTVAKFWLTDLFLEEDGRYTTTRTEEVTDAIENVEIAGYELIRDGESILIAEVEGTTKMPWQSFNMRVVTGLRESGDLRRRVIIREQNAVLIVPEPDNDRTEIVLNLPFNDMDEKKKAIFQGVDTIEVDLTDILAEFDGAPLFLQGTHNYERLKAILENPAELERIRKKAISMRTISNLSNGELGVGLASPTEVDSVRFFAPFNSSNDFSVAGLILAGQ